MLVTLNKSQRHGWITMATKYKVGELNEVNGFKIELTRYTKACQDGTSRAARFWGTITTPEGEEIISPENGWTVEQIDRKIGVTDKKVYNLTGERSSRRESEKVRKLRKALHSLEDAGLPTDEAQSALDAALAEEEATKAEREREIAEAREIERANREELRAKKKALKAEIRKKEKAMKALKDAGMEYFAVEQIVNELKAELESL